MSPYNLIQIYFFNKSNEKTVHTATLLHTTKKGNNRHTVSKNPYFYCLIDIGMDDRDVALKLCLIKPSLE